MTKSVLFLVFVFLNVQFVFTQSIVSKPTGGTSTCVSDDFQLLGDLVISETNFSDFQYFDGSIDSLYLQLPSGFTFNTAATVTVSINSADITGVPVVGVTSSMVKIGLAVGNANAALDVITISGLEIKATSTQTNVSLSRVVTSDDVKFIGLEISSATSYADLNSYAYPVGVTAGTDVEVCNTAIIPIIGNDPTPFNGSWYPLDGDNVTATTDFSTTVTGVAQAETGRFVWVVTNNGCVTTDTVAVINKTFESSSAGTGIELCNTPSTSLSGNSPIVSTGMWTLISGIATITNPTDKNTTVTAIPVGTSVVLEWELTNGACQSTDQVTVNNYQSVTVANAGSTIELCNTTSTNLSANTPILGTGSWSIVSGTATIVTPSSPTTAVSGIGAGNTVQFEWTIENGACLSSDIVSVTNYAPATTAVAGTDIELCNTSTAVLNANAAVIGDGTWSVLSGIATVTDNTDPSSGVTSISVGNALKLKWEIVNGACSSKDSVEIINYQTPTIADAGGDFLICDVISGNLAGNTASIGQGAWSTTSVATISAVNNEVSPVSNLTFENNYSFIWEITNGVCPATKDTVVVTVNAKPTQPTIITGDNSVCENEINVNYLTPPVSFATKYNWAIPSGDAAFVSASTIDNVTLNFSGTTNSILEITAENVCGISTKQSLAITQNALPSGVTISGNVIPDCNNLTTEFYQANTAPLTNETYTWTVPVGATIIGQNDAQAVGVQFGSTNGNVVLLVTNTLTGCENAFTYSVSLNCGVSFSMSSTEICSGDQVTFNNTTIGASSSATYKWTIDGVVYNGEGPHSIVLTSTNTTDIMATLEVTDGTVSAVSNLIRVNELPVLSLIPKGVSCFGGDDGAIDLTVSGGGGVYSYVWLPSNSTNEDLLNILQDTYQVTVTDNKLCVNTGSSTVNEPTDLIISLVSKSEVNIFGGTNGSAEVTVGGGTPNYSFNWIPSAQSSATLSNVEAGAHLVLVTDDNFCTKSFDVTITEPSELLGGLIDIENVTDDGIDICRGDLLPNLGNTFSASGGTNVYTYEWQYSEDFGGSWLPYSLSNSEGFSPNVAVNQFTQIRRKVSDDQGALEYSNILNFIFRDTTDVSVVKPVFPSNAYCENNKVLYLSEAGTESGINGNFVGISVIDNGDGTAFLDMQTSGSGIQTYIYTYTNSYGCVSTLNEQVQVYKKPTVVINGLIANYSASSLNDTAVVSPPFSLGRGILLGNGLESDTVFNPTAGDIITNVQDTITYVYTDANGCGDTTTHLFRVNSADGSINNLNASREYCIYDNDIVLEGNPVGGTVTDFKVYKLKHDGTIEMSGGNPVELNYVWRSVIMDSLQFDFDEVMSFYTPTITFVDVLFVFSYIDQGAPFDINEKVRVFNKPSLTFNIADLDYCENDNALDLTSFVTPYVKGYGVFQISSGILQDTLFVPAIGDIDGKDTLEYVFTDPVSSCVNTTSQVVLVNSLPVVTISGFGSTYCENDPKVIITGTPLPNVDGAAVFIGPSLVNSGIGQVDFTPNASVKNTDVTVTYQYTDLNTGCLNMASGQFRVDSVPVLGIKGLKAAFCEGENALLTGVVGGIEATFYSARPSYFSGSSALISDVNTTDGEADLTVSSIIDFNQNHTVTYTFTDGNNCTSAYQGTVIVDSLPVINFTTSSYGYCSDPSATAPITPNVSGGTVIVNGVDQGANRDISLSSAGLKNIEYTVIASTGCFATYTDSIYVNLTPTIFFVESSNCIVDSVEFEQLTINVLPIGFPQINYVKWEWDFGDLGNNDTSSLASPNYKYSTEGFRSISLHTTTDSNCVSTVEQTIAFYENPKADFSWGNVCAGQDSTEFVNQSSPSNLVDSSFWDFSDGSLLDERLFPNHLFTFSDEYEVQLIVKTIAGCIDTVKKTVDVFPFEQFVTGDYNQDFELSAGGWFSSGLDTTKNSWSLASIPASSPIINKANSGSQAYVTSANGDYLTDELSYVTSPCFALDLLDRPMVKFSYLSAFTDQDDGVVMQYIYSYRDQDGVLQSSEWTNLGDRDNEGVSTGLNWYNSSTIDSKPGGLTSRGWTGMSLVGEDTTWVEARHELDFIIEEVALLNGEFQDVRLRFALGSDLQSTGEGFAFDDFWIGDRSRRVLYEHFTNTLCTTCLQADVIADNVVDKYMSSGDVVEIQYHTGSPQEDPLYNENPADANKRSLFYSVPTVPYSIMDGNQFFGSTDDWVSDSLNVRLRALTDPLFGLTVSSTTSGSNLTVLVDVKAHIELSNGEDVVLYVALIDKSKDVSDLGSIVNGQTVFKRVIRKFLPNNAGTLLAGDWLSGDEQQFSFIYDLQNLDQDNLGVVVFVQDNEANGTKEVYQANYTDVTVVNGVVEEYAVSSDLKIFPNPSTGNVTVALPIYKEKIRVKIYCTVGVQVYDETIKNSIHELNLDLGNLPNGIYLIKVEVDGDNEVIGKLFLQSQ